MTDEGRSRTRFGVEVTPEDEARLQADLDRITQAEREKPWWCECRYGVIGPICTHCGRTRPASDDASGPTP